MICNDDWFCALQEEAAGPALAHDTGADHGTLWMRVSAAVLFVLKLVSDAILFKSGLVPGQSKKRNALWARSRIAVHKTKFPD